MKILRFSAILLALVFSGCAISQSQSTNNISSLEKECKGGNLESCHTLASTYRGGWDRVKEDKVKAIEIYVENCKNEYAKSCHVAGHMFEHGMEIQRDYEVAFGLYERGCEGEYAESCNKIAEAFYKGDILKKDDASAKKFLDKSIRLYKKQCENKIGESCGGLGSIYHYGKIIHDSEKSFYYYKKGCEYKDNNSCTMKEAFEKEAKEKARLEKSCEDKKVDDCYEVANRYRNGIGVKADKAKATKYFKKACKLGDKSSCILIYRDDYSKKAFKEVGKLCDGGYALACRALGKKYTKKQNKKRAAKAYKKACKLGDGLSCY